MKTVWCVIGITLFIISTLISLPKQNTSDKHYINYIDQRNRKILYTPIVLNISDNTDEAYYNVFLDLIHLCKNKRHVDLYIKDYEPQIIGNFPSLAAKFGDTIPRQVKNIHYNSLYHIIIQCPSTCADTFVQVAENIAYDCGFKILYQN